MLCICVFLYKIFKTPSKRPFSQNSLFTQSVSITLKQKHPRGRLLLGLLRELTRLRLLLLPLFELAHGEDLALLADVFSGPPEGFVDLPANLAVQNHLIVDLVVDLRFFEAPAFFLALSPCPGVGLGIALEKVVAFLRVHLSSAFSEIRHLLESPRFEPGPGCPRYIQPLLPFGLHQIEFLASFEQLFERLPLV